MLEFKVVKESKKSKARLGLLKTAHNVVETPYLVPVATQGVVKTLTAEEVVQTKSKLLICNTFHLHLRPGEEVVKKAGGLHKFMNWPGSLMTDSGGFQVFSLGFGRDHGVGKILKNKRDLKIGLGQQPNFLKITPAGVHFRSFLDGKEIFLGPKESIKIQEKLGADIILAFDECTSPVANYAYTKESLERTHAWAIASLKAKNQRLKTQSLFGIVQGGRFKDLRIASAKFMSGLPFSGFAIGGEFGDDKELMMKMLGWVNEELPSEKPRHLLGIGHLEDIPKIIKKGVDTFDCIVPAHYARRGIAFTSAGKINLRPSKFLTDLSPLDRKCKCLVCQNYKKNYLCHLLRAKEITALKLLTFHNLYFFQSFIEEIRQKIKEGKF